MKASPLQHWIGSICRTLLGITFIFSGFVKAVDPLGTTYKIEDYLNAFGGFFEFFTPMAEIGAWMLIIFEFVLGWMLLCNVWTKISSWLALAMMLVMTPITLYLALTNPISDCGCFGDAVVLSNWQTFWKNVVLLVLVVVLLCTKRHIPRLFVWQAELGITCLAIGAALGIMTYARLNLPFLDFRPYAVGNNIPELMEIPDDAPQDVYDIKLIYEKDGIQQEFNLDNYPKDDSWTFVDQKSVLVSKGFEPKIHDFEITNQDLDDLTYDILEEEEATLAILYKVERCNMKQAQRLNDMAQQYDNEGRSFYLITGSSEDAIENFRQQAAYDFPIYGCDPVTLKTIVRANPGIVVLHEGTIVDKYNLRTR